MKKIIKGLAKHVHHNKLIEYCYDFNERVKVIKETKLINEQEIRLRLFKMLSKEAIAALPKTLQKAYATCRRQTLQGRRLTLHCRRQPLQGCTLHGRRKTPHGRRLTLHCRRQPLQGCTLHGRRQTPHGRRKTPHGRRQTPHGRRQTPQGRRLTLHGRRITLHGRRHTLHGRRQTPHGQGLRCMVEGRHRMSRQKKVEGLRCMVEGRHENLA